MTTVSIEWNPSRDQLRGFGDVAMFFFVLLALFLRFVRGIEADLSLYICAIGTGIYLASRIWAPLVKPVYIGLTVITFPMGWMVSNVVLIIVFYLIFVPIALAFRVLRRDPLNIRTKLIKGTYWCERPISPPKKRYFDQY